MSDDIEPYVVPHESICINGEWYDVENASHCVIGGQEYIWLEDQLYELHGAFLGDPVILPDDEPDDGQDYPQYEPPSQTGGGKSILTYALIFLIAAGVMAVVMGELGYTKFDLDPPTSSVVAAGTATPKATSASVTSSWDAQASKVVEAMDYTDPDTRDFALSMIDRGHGGDYNIAQICDMWEKMYKRWTYVNDPNGFNYYSPASRTINLGLKGDCDDFAILVASTISAIGGTPRVILAYNTDSIGHAYAKVAIADSKSDLDNIAKYICQRYNCKGIAYRTSNEGGKTTYWLNLDWWSKHPGGTYYQNNGETVAIYPNKHWVRLK